MTALVASEDNSHRALSTSWVMPAKSRRSLSQRPGSLCDVFGPLAQEQDFAGIVGPGPEAAQ